MRLINELNGLNYIRFKYYTYGGSALVFAYKFTPENRDEFGIV